MTDYILDAGTFQRQLGDLATTLAFKVQREGIKVLGRSTGIADIYVLVRQAQRTYDLFFYLNADEHRTSPDWRPIYTIVALPLVRSMIDCLYNITVMLDDPKTKPAEFRKSGYKMALEALKEDELKYGSHPDPRYTEWLQKHRDNLDLTMRVDKFELEDVMAQKRWPPFFFVFSRSCKHSFALTVLASTSGCTKYGMLSCPLPK